MYKNKLTIAAAVIILACFLNWNCTKIDTTSLGGGLIPEVDNVNTFDTLISVITTNYDSANKVCDSFSRHGDHALGYIGNDPLFGTTKASIFLQLKPASYPFTYPTDVKSDLIFDSVVLVLHYTKTYGDSNSLQKVNVYSLNQDQFKYDSSYYSCNNFTYNTLLGSKTYTAKGLSDTSKSFKDTTVAQFRVKLNDSFGQYLLTQDSSNTFKNDSIFQKNVPGFAIIPESQGNSISYFNYDQANTKLALYYRYRLKNTSGGYDTTKTVTYFRFTANSGESNLIVKNRAGAEIQQHLAQPVQGDSVVYIETTPGTYATINVPGLNNLSNRIVHRAELVIEQVYDPSNTTFAAPDFLYLERKDTAKLYGPIPCDFNIANNTPDLSNFGGYKTDAKDAFGRAINKYTFNITRYVQNFIVSKGTDMSLKLSAPYHVINHTGYYDACRLFVSPFNFNLNDMAEGRVKLGGGNSTNYKMKLRIVYSKL